MSAGTAYAKRFAGGFVDLPTKTTPVDQQFLNAVEVALLQLIGAAPTADGQVAQWDNANTRFGPALLLNKNIDPAAAIAKSKLDLTGANGIVDADISGVAAIARSKLNFGSGLVNADIAAAAALAISKLAGYPTNASKFLRGDGTWGGLRLAIGTKAANVSSAGATFAAGADVLAAALSFTADGTSSYLVTITAPDWRNTTNGVNDTEVALNLDGADAGRIATLFMSGAASNSSPLVGRIVITPSAGAHTVNCRLIAPGGGNAIIDAGAGGAGLPSPIVVTVEVV